MFGSLFFKECKMWSKNILFYAYIIILFLFYVTQMGSESPLVKPEQGQKDYGITYSENEIDIMNGTLKTLLGEYYAKNYVTYPMGFYKSVIISDRETEEVEKYISQLTGITEDEWKQNLDQYYAGIHTTEGEDGNTIQGETEAWPFVVSQTVDYDEFLSVMSQIEEVIGKGSYYNEDNLQRNATVPMAYEQALEEYDEILEKDKVTGAYARLFSDYTGIILAILPAFFGVTRVLKDKRSSASGVIYSKKCSSATIVFSRCLAMITMLFIPVLIISCFSLGESAYIAKVLNVQPDYFAYLKYCIGWLLPIIIFVSTLAYLITELTENVLAILVNGVLWFLSIFLGMNTPLISIGWNLVPRFNELGKYSVLEPLFCQLVKNRILYSGLGILTMVFAIAVYSYKRKGGYLIGGKISKNRRGES